MNNSIKKLIEALKKELERLLVVEKEIEEFMASPQKKLDIFRDKKELLLECKIELNKKYIDATDFKKILNSVETIPEKILQYKSIIEFLESSDEELVEASKLFFSFEPIIELKNVSFKEKELYEIFNEVMKKNKMILDKSKKKVVLLNENNCRILGNFKYVKKILNEYSIEELEEMLKKAKVELQYEELQTVKNIERMFDSIKTHVEIIKDFFPLQENLKSEDKNNNETVKEIIEFLGMPGKFADYYIFKYKEDLKNLSNEERKEVTKKIIIEPKEKVEKSKQEKKILTDQEYKKMIKEIKDTVKSLKDETCDLSYEEIIELGKKLILTGYCDEQNAIVLMNQAGLKEKELKENPVLDYISMYDKLCFYENKEFIYEELENIRECIQSMMICSDEDYIIYKEMIEEEMIKIREKLFYKDEYERNLIRK
ncbi:MAG: hypothetical protein E7158_05630 [Firmicutes bacterium]|nr:hypothetical protein [Bacillota bacterium]